MELSEKLRIKTQQSLNRKEFTEKVYLEIREEMFKRVVSYLIEKDCSDHFHLSYIDLIPVLCKKYKYKTFHSYFRVEDGAGTEAHATYPDMSWRGDLTPDQFERHERMYREAKRLLLDIDYAELTLKLRSYILSFGLDVYKPSYAKATELSMRFKCNKLQLVRAIEKFEGKPVDGIVEAGLDGSPKPLIGEHTDLDFYESISPNANSERGPLVHAICWVIALSVLVIALWFIFFG